MGSKEEEVEEKKGSPEEPLCQPLPRVGLSPRALSGLGEQASSYHWDMPDHQPAAASWTTGAVAYLAEALLWVGGSVVVSPQWQLNLLGKKGHRAGPSWGLAKPCGTTGCIAS